VGLLQAVVVCDRGRHVQDKTEAVAQAPARACEARANRADWDPERDGDVFVREVRPGEEKKRLSVPRGQRVQCGDDLGGDWDWRVVRRAELSGRATVCQQAAPLGAPVMAQDVCCDA
jgi:hypothetical protein